MRPIRRQISSMDLHSMFALQIVLPCAVAILMALVAATHAGNGDAALIDQDRYFLDSDTAMYWYDPGVWVAQGRLTADRYQSSSSIWRWATSAEVDGLTGKSTTGASDIA